MADVESLQASIDQYKEQLSQVNQALSVAPDGPDKDNLLGLRADIQELVALTAESLQNACGTARNTDNSCDYLTNINNDDISDPIDREYALFKAELEKASEDPKLTESNNESTEASNDIEDELKALEGMKCRAPHGSSWGGTGHHNAMVSCIYRNEEDEISSINDIKVRVLFVNPTHKEMLPCPYYLDGSCKFSEEQCHYSHGEIVPLSSLEEYREPDFSTLRMGSRVLAKQSNGLWHRCVILKLPDKEGDHYRIKFESSGKIMEIAVQELLPLGDADLDMSDTSDESESDVEIPKENLVQRSLMTLNSGEPLGKWEQHTKGIGSKLMAQMGYVHGTGLGKRADGRVDPVEATVLPAGKSLDHCMELREFAGGDTDFFSAERKMRKQRLRMEQQREKQYLRDKAREKNDIFNFINKSLVDKPAEKNEASSSKGKSDLKSQTNRGLNVANFQIGENIARLEKESSKLKDSLSRHSKGSLPYNNIVVRYNEKQNELATLRATQSTIASEQNLRKDKAKLSIF